MPDNNSLNKLDFVELLKNKQVLKITLTGTVLYLLFFLSIKNQVFAYVGVGLILIVSFKFSIENLFYTFLFILANQRIFVTNISSISLLNLILFFLLIKIALHQKFKKSIVIHLIVLFIYSLIISIFNSNFINVFSIVKFGLLILVLSNIFLEYGSKSDWIRKLVLFYILGCIVTNIISLFFIDNFVIGTRWRFTGGPNNNPNLTGAVISFSVAILLTYSKYAKQKFWGILIVLIILISFGLLTQSRSFFLATTFSLLYYIFIDTSLTRKIIFGSLTIIALITLVLLLIFVFNDTFFGEIFNSALYRIIYPVKGGISGTRFSIWHSYWSGLIQNPDILLFGSNSQKVMELFGLERTAHNSFLELIVSWGVMGGTIIILLYYNIFYILRNNISTITYNGGNFIGYLPIIVILLISITNHSILSMYFAVNIFISYLFIIKTRGILQETKNIPHNTFVK